MNTLNNPEACEQVDSCLILKEKKHFCKILRGRDGGGILCLVIH